MVGGPASSYNQVVPKPDVEIESLFIPTLTFATPLQPGIGVSSYGDFQDQKLS